MTPSEELSKLRRVDNMYTGNQLAEIFRVAKLVRDDDFASTK